MGLALRTPFCDRSGLPRIQLENCPATYRYEPNSGESGRISKHRSIPLSLS